MAESVVEAAPTADRLVVYHHLGLGDHLICNGLVRRLAEQHEYIYLACKRSSLPTVACLYSEVRNVEPIPIDREPDDVEAFARRSGAPVRRIGFEACDRLRFDQSFYEQVGMPFEFRWSKFRLPTMISGEDEAYDRLRPSASAYRIVHREASHGPYGLRLDTTLPTVEIRRSLGIRNLLAYRRLIREAAEIHCINSCVIHLVDSMDTPGRLVYHDVRSGAFQLRRQWEIVPYAARPLREFCTRIRGAIIEWAAHRATTCRPDGPR